MNRQNNQYLGAIIGHAVGDAMGFPTEFSKREELLQNPVIEMIDSPDVGQPAGSWSDDTAMEIATIDSFIQKKCFDYKDIMDKWVKWISKSEYTSTGVAFDIGRTCLKAIKKYCNGTAPLQCGATSINENGNGSLMRILPVALYAYSKKLDDTSIHKLTNEVSSLTHAHEVSRLGCYIYVQFIICLLKGNTKQEAYKHIQDLDYRSFLNLAGNGFQADKSSLHPPFSLTITMREKEIRTFHCTIPAYGNILRWNGSIQRNLPV